MSRSGVIIYFSDRKAVDSVTVVRKMSKRTRNVQKTTYDRIKNDPVISIEVTIWQYILENPIKVVKCSRKLDLLST